MHDRSGIDHGLVTHLARWVLAEIGIVPKALVVATREQLEGKTRNTSAIPIPAMKDTCEFLEEELEEIYPDAGIKFPIDVERRIDGGAAVGAHRTSMLQDLDQGRPMEIDALVGSVQELGRVTDTPTPTIDTVLALIKLRGRSAGLYE